VRYCGSYRFSYFYGSGSGFSTISLKRAKSRPTILLESYKIFLPQVDWHVSFYCTNEVCYTKY